jgi:hypothetical protein
MIHILGLKTWGRLDHALDGFVVKLRFHPREPARAILLLPLSLNKSISRVILSQIFLHLFEFIEKSITNYEINKHVIKLYFYSVPDDTNLVS